MNSEVNNNGESSSSQVSLLSLEFKMLLDRKLDEEKTSVEAKIAEITAENAAWKENVRTRYANIKQTKKKINASKNQTDELENTRDKLRQCGRDYTEWTQLLKRDLKNYRGENIALEKEHEESIQDMENKWKIYQAQYETLPLAVVRTEKRTELRREKIELIVKEYNLAEIKKILSKQEEIHTKRRNNLAIECAVLYKEIKLEDIEIRAALVTRKNLEEKIQQQDKTITELTEKRKQKLATAQQNVAKKSNEKKFPLIVPLQRRPQLVRRVDLISETLTQPMPTFHKDNYDTISISSSIIDNLIEPKNLQQTEIIDYPPGHQNNDQTLDGASLDSNDEVFTGQEDHQIPLNDNKPSDPVLNNEEKSLVRFEEEYAMDLHFESQDIAEYDPPKAEEERKHSEQDMAESEYSAIREAPNKKLGRVSVAESNLPRQLELGESQIKKPRIMKVEKVQLNVRPEKILKPKTLREDSLARYFAASSGSTVDYNWKRANHPSSIFSFQDSERGNTGFESNLGSDTSMQSEDIIKKYHISFASDHGDREECENLVHDNQSQFVTPQTGFAEPSQIGGTQAATPFLNMFNIDTPNSRGNKKDPFSLSMF